jgi:hypothetical protein
MAEPDTLGAALADCSFHVFRIYSDLRSELGLDECAQGSGHAGIAETPMSVTHDDGSWSFGGTVLGNSERGLMED